MDKDIIGAIVLVFALVVQQFFNRKSGKSDVNKLQQESIRLNRQTSETVNSCKAENKVVLNAIEKHMAKNDLRYVSTKLSDAVRMLETMADHQSKCLGALDRVGGLVRSIADDLQKTDSRIVHKDIQNKIEMVENMVEDIKRIVLSK